MFGNTLLDENYLFFRSFFLSLQEYVLKAISLNVVFIGHDLFRNEYGRWMMLPHSLIFRQESTVRVKMNPLRRIRPSPLAQMFVG